MQHTKEWGKEKGYSSLGRIGRKWKASKEKVNTHKFPQNTAIKNYFEQCQICMHK